MVSLDADRKILGRKRASKKGAKREVVKRRNRVEITGFLLKGRCYNGYRERKIGFKIG